MKRNLKETDSLLQKKQLCYSKCNDKVNEGFKATEGSSIPKGKSQHDNMKKLLQIRGTMISHKIHKSHKLH